MPVQIVNNGATLKITTSGVSRLISKSQIYEISVIKTNIIKLDLGLGAWHSVYITYADVDSPVTATPEALRDSINAMLPSSSGGSSGTATDTNQLSEITQLQSIVTALNLLNNTVQGSAFSDPTSGNPLIVDESNPNVIYRGFALPGASTSAAVWSIQKGTISGDITTFQWANGNKNFTNIWNSRTTLTYS